MNSNYYTSILFLFFHFPFHQGFDDQGDQRERSGVWAKSMGGSSGPTTLPRKLMLSDLSQVDEHDGGRELYGSYELHFMISEFMTIVMIGLWHGPQGSTLAIVKFIVLRNHLRRRTSNSEVIPPHGPASEIVRWNFQLVRSTEPSPASDVE